MDRAKLDRQIKKFEEYLVVDMGLSKNTSHGYCRSTSIALRRMRKLVPKYIDIKRLIKWMHDQKYSYSHIVNTCLALEHYTRFKGDTRGASLMMIQQQLRHRFIESTMIYVYSRPLRNRNEYDFHKPAYM